MKTNKKIENKQKSSILGDQVKTMANSLREMMEMDLKTIDSETALKNIEALEKESRRIDKEIKRLQKDEKKILKFGQLKVKAEFWVNE